MTATPSPSPAELYTTMRTSGNPAAAASVLDLYCATARGVAASVDSCHGDVLSTPCCSPDARSGLSPVNLQSMSGSAALEATALRLMLAGSRHQLAPHHQGALPSLSLHAAGTSMHGNQPSAAHRHPAINDASAFYLPSNLQMAAEMSSPDTWNGLYNSSIGLNTFDARANAEYQSYLQCYGGLHDVRRKNATRESTSTLKTWLIQHIKNPYPTKGEKIMLAIITKMTLTQVSTWFANARRRLKKENKMQWSPRQRTGDDDDDDAEDDDLPNDAMNASFGASDDEYSNDVISDDRGFHGSRSSPASRLSSNTSANDNSDDHVTPFDHRRHATSSDVEEHRLPFEYRRHVIDHRSPRDQSSPEARKSTADDVIDDTDGERQVPTSNKPRIWSIANLVTSSDDERKDHLAVTSSNSYHRPTSSSQSGCVDYRQWNVAIRAAEANEAFQSYFRRQLSERFPPSSAVANIAEQVMFPAVAVEALRWQMAAAACRAAANAASTGTVPDRFDGTVPITASSDGNSATSRTVSPLALR